MVLFKLTLQSLKTLYFKTFVRFCCPVQQISQFPVFFANTHTHTHTHYKFPIADWRFQLAHYTLHIVHYILLYITNIILHCTVYVTHPILHITHFTLLLIVLTLINTVTIKEAPSLQFSDVSMQKHIDKTFDNIQNNVFIWDEQYQFEIFDLSPVETFIKNVIYIKIVTDKD